jgi:hypothetical protein
MLILAIFQTHENFLIIKPYKQMKTCWLMKFSTWLAYQQFPHLLKIDYNLPSHISSGSLFKGLKSIVLMEDESSAIQSEFPYSWYKSLGLIQSSTL